MVNARSTRARLGSATRATPDVNARDRLEGPASRVKRNRNMTDSFQAFDAAPGLTSVVSCTNPPASDPCKPPSSGPSLRLVLDPTEVPLRSIVVWGARNCAPRHRVFLCGAPGGSSSAAGLLARGPECVGCRNHPVAPLVDGVPISVGAWRAVERPRRDGGPCRVGRRVGGFCGCASVSRRPGVFAVGTVAPGGNTAVTCGNSERSRPCRREGVDLGIRSRYRPRIAERPTVPC